jgi:hypothetical protein
MEQRRQVAAAQAKAIADEANERHQAAHRQQLIDKHATRACQQKAVALRQRLCLLSESVAERERQREAPALCQRLRLLSESVAERQRSAELAAQRKQVAVRTICLWLRRRLLLFRTNHRTLRRQQRDAALARLRYEQDCCMHAAVTQERRCYEEAAERAAVSAQRVRQRARPCRCTGRRNCPRAPSPPDEAPLSHPHQMLGGLHTPASTTSARATSLCGSVVSSTTPSSMAPPTPSLLPFTFIGDVVHSSSGGGATYPFRVSSPPWKRTRRKPRPRRVCRHHGPRAPNQVEPLLSRRCHRPCALLCGQRHRPRTPNQSTCDGWE